MCDIAIQGKVAATKEAAKHFLANAGMPWILIIDNADDEDLDLEDYFPPGERGCILITTRDSDKKHLGTIGSRFYCFERLPDDEAVELLLTTAEEPSPYTEEAVRQAKKISKTLHCLPLALVLAGQTIRKRYASWVGYLNYFKQNRQALARKAITCKEGPGKHDRERRACVYVNFEPLLIGMESSTDQAAKDAFELMQLFAFLHHRNIRRDILIKAVRNPLIEEKASRAEQENPDASPQQRSQGWVDNVKRQLSRLVEQILTNPKYSWLLVQQRTILPAILRQDAVVDGEVDSIRLEQAIYHLQKHSFISPGEEPDTYTVHPLIHEWMRIRLDSPGSEAIWCEAAAIALAKCIILDANALSPERVSMRTSRHFISTQLLPHIRHVRQCQHNLDDKFKTIRQRIRRPLFPLRSFSSLTPLEATRLAKFSIVYLQCGEWQVAKQLQEQVREYVIQMRGIDHPVCHRITAALSATYYHLDMFPHSIRMMRDIVASSQRMYGDDNPHTLKAIDSLAQFLCYSGRLTESLELHTKAWEGFAALKSHGPKHKDSLLALRHLGAVKSRFFCYSESARLCELALEGLSACNDVEDEILFTKEDIALALAADRREPDRARALMEEVLERRKNIWGEEGIYTLFAELNYGRVEHGLGDYRAAEARLQRILPVGVRSIGRTHNGVVLAEMFLARSWVGLKRYAEAEDLYKRVLIEHAEGGRHRGSDDHVQRILAEWFLVECFDESGKLAEAHEAAENLLDSLAKIGDAGYGLKHPLHGQVVKKLAEIRMRMSGETRDDG
jgi:tetratricopeptide (TPR) repeat protein